jgi:DNA-binding transcriptional LysR family regulator
VPLRSGLNTLGRALSEPTGFEPQTARRSFCLATPDLFDVLAIPRLLERIGLEAPGVDITCISIDASRLSDRLETGEIDAAIVPQVEEIRPVTGQPQASGLVRRTLFRDRHVCLMRGDHPHGRAAARGKLSLATFAELSHMVVSPQGSGPGIVDRMLEQRGLRRRVALRIPHFYSALAILANCDLVLTAPTGLALLAARDRRIISFEPPLRLPNHNGQLLWHERWTNDPGHNWLRGLLIEIGREILR